MSNSRSFARKRQWGAAGLTAVTIAVSGAQLPNCDDLDCVRSMREGQEVSFVRDPATWQFITTFVAVTGSASPTGVGAPAPA